jgi:hypothetical protein
VIYTYFGNTVSGQTLFTSLCDLREHGSSSACLRLRLMLPWYWSPRVGHTCKRLLGSNFLVVDFWKFINITCSMCFVALFG